MDRTSFPAPLSTLFARLPQYPPSVVAAVAINLWLGARVSGAALPAALGKVVAIAISDMGLHLTFVVEDSGIVARSGMRPDVTIRATANDFLALAMRREDPDTLFFSRRLVIEGDTELGLFLKNSLDAMPATVLEFRLPTLRGLLKSLRLQCPPGLLPNLPYPNVKAWRR